MWKYWMCDSRTGIKLAPCVPIAAPWSARLSGGAGEQQAQFVLSDDADARVMRDESLYRSWACTLVQEWDGVVKQAGMIQLDDYDIDSRLLTLTHVDFETFVGDRYPFGPGSYFADEPAHLPGSLTITAKSYPAAVAKVLEQGTLGPADIYSLPLSWPSTATAGTFSATWFNYNWQSVGDLTKDFRDLGVDVVFEPRWSGLGRLELLIRVGAPGDELVGNTYEFNMTDDVAEKRLTGVHYVRDGTMQITGQFGVGEGSGTLMRVGGDGLFGAATIPARDMVEQYKNERNEARLASYGTAAVAAFGEPSVRFEGMKLIPTVEPGLGPLRLADLFVLEYRDNPRVPDGKHTVRVMGMSGTGTQDEIVSIDVQHWAA